ncbi:D-alanyl-D-alanine carboxypeptidase family protein [Aestuariibius insulae]|uniref:D-alanyl-D-alanine carboxypeptidase family protein n=1 Tax=Aestuariibius insulae TaxID=2058287 RepID=UPI00345F0E37
MVIDARTGEVLHSRNADTRLHPASLTKMMTLYVAFEAVENGELSLDTMITIPQVAANEPPSKLGLRAGQKIKLRYLIRASAVKSANDAATAIGVAIEGSEAAFARRMNRTAQSLGMTRTTFRNAHGLTESGHMSTARDMTILGRHVLYDYPQYYNLFSRRSTHAGIKEVANTNRRLLNSYRGADGIKTGYTRAAGSNLVASAERGSERVIATVFGGQSSAWRNQRVAELLDMGFERSPTRAAIRHPGRPAYMGSQRGTVVASADTPVVVNRGGTRLAGRTIRVSGAVTRSLRPTGRPVEAPDILLVSQSDILKAVEEAQSLSIAAAVTPEVRPPEAQPSAEQEVVTRVSTSGGRHWAVNVGRYGSKFRAQQSLLQVALMEMGSLDGSTRKVVKSPQGFDAHFVGLTREGADLACRRLQARGKTCFMVGPAEG